MFFPIDDCPIQEKTVIQVKQRNSQLGCEMEQGLEDVYLGGDKDQAFGFLTQLGPEYEYL